MRKFIVFFSLILLSLCQDIKFTTGVVQHSSGSSSSGYHQNFQYQYNYENSYQLDYSFIFSYPISNKIKFIIGYQIIEFETNLKSSVFDLFTDPNKITDISYNIKTKLFQFPIGLKLGRKLSDLTSLYFFGMINFQNNKLKLSQLKSNAVQTNSSLIIDDLSNDLETKTSYQFGVEVDSKLYDNLFLNLEFNYISNKKTYISETEFSINNQNDTFNTNVFKISSNNVFSLNIGLKYHLTFLE